MPLMRDYQTEILKVYFNGATAPNAGQFRVLLLNSLSSPNVLTDASSTASVAANEKTSGNGYTARYTVDFADATYNTVTERAEVPQVTVTITASGGTLNGAGFALLSNASTSLADTTGKVVAYFPSSFSIPDTESRTFVLNLSGEAV